MCTYEEARARVAQLGMTEETTGSPVPGAGDTAHMEPQSVELIAGRRELKVSTRERSATCPLPERLFEVALAGSRVTPSAPAA